MFGIQKEKIKKDEQKGSAEDEDLQRIFAEEKTEMINGVECLSKKTVKEVMVPRIDVDFISVNTSLEELVKKISESGHSRIPVFSSSVDNIVGVLYVKDLIKVLAEKEIVDLEKIIRKPYFVPESKHIDSLLREFKRRHVHIAIAIDEYGGVSGIVCMEDIIEEIVGDIQDEFDNEHEDLIALSENAWICNGRIDLDVLNDETGSDFPAKSFETLGGFVFDLFGKIPVKFEKTSWKQYDFIIQEMEGHKISTVKVVRRKEE